MLKTPPDDFFITEGEVPAAGRCSCKAQPSQRQYSQPDLYPDAGKRCRIERVPVIRLEIGDVLLLREFTQPLTEMSTRNIKIIMSLGSKVLRERGSDKLTAICEPIV
jgi:hypothetical protein